MQNKILAHANVIDWVCGFLPVTEAVLEIGEFDTQKLNNPDIGGADYQYGARHGFYNTKQYVLWRDGYKCQCCKGRSKDEKLNVHHIVHRAAGGSNKPDNLVTLCETCHKAYHAGTLSLQKFSVKRSVRDAAHMNAMHYAVLAEAQRRHPNLALSHTYGYITKAVREKHGIAKTHAADARVISSHPDAAPQSSIYRMRKVRRHNRQIYKAKILKGGVRKRNQAAYEVNGFRLFDRVRYRGTECFVYSKRSDGRLSLKTLCAHGDLKYEKPSSLIVTSGVTHKRVTLINRQSAYVVEHTVPAQQKRDGAPPRGEPRGSRARKVLWHRMKMVIFRVTAFGIYMEAYYSAPQKATREETKEQLTCTVEEAFGDKGFLLASAPCGGGLKIKAFGTREEACGAMMKEYSECGKDPAGYASDRSARIYHPSKDVSLWKVFRRGETEGGVLFRYRPGHGSGADSIRMTWYGSQFISEMAERKLFEEGAACAKDGSSFRMGSCTVGVLTGEGAGGSLTHTCGKAVFLEHGGASCLAGTDDAFFAAGGSVLVSAKSTGRIRALAGTYESLREAMEKECARLRPGGWNVHTEGSAAHAAKGQTEAAWRIFTEADLA